MINSPIKQKIANRAGHLRPITQRQREIVGRGSQSVVLENGHNEVYVVTRTIVAKNIELLRGLSEDPTLFSIPKVVGINENLLKIMSPNAPRKSQKQLSKQYDITLPQLWESNIIYSLPRYDGTLEDLNTMRFNEDSIETLYETIHKALTYLHDNGLSHNDISLRNIFYKGEHPHLKFFLGDFGLLSRNDAATHETKCGTDIMRLDRVIGKVREILACKEKNREKKKALGLTPAFTRHSRMVHAAVNTSAPRAEPKSQAPEKARPIHRIV